MTFEGTLFRLRERLREKVRNGELTERGMARATGVSQPHLHNILKGIRSLPPELADQLLPFAGCRMEHLWTPEPVGGADPQRGAGLGLEAAVNRPRDKAIDEAQPCRERPSPQQRLLPYELLDDPAMEPKFQSGDMVYYEPGEKNRSEPEPRSCYLVHWEDKVCARYLRMGGQRLYLVSEHTLQNPPGWNSILLTDRNILEVVRGRIVWICRKVGAAKTVALEEIGGEYRRTG